MECDARETSLILWRGDIYKNAPDNKYQVEASFPVPPRHRKTRVVAFRRKALIPVFHSVAAASVVFSPGAGAEGRGGGRGFSMSRGQKQS